jgi:hypothetical protein
MLVIANIVIPPALMLEYNSREISRTAALAVCFFSAIVVNVCVLFFIRLLDRRLGRRTSNGLVVFAILFGALSTPIASYGLLSRESTDDNIERIAYSHTPLSQIRPEPKRLAVELLRRREANSRAYGQLTASAKPLSPMLYSAPSFANETACRETLVRLQRTTDEDFAYFQKQEQAGKEFHDKLMRIDPASGFLKLADSLDGPAVAMESLEQHWLSSVVALYDYAGAHTKEIAVENGELHYSSEAIRVEFVKRLTDSYTLFQQFQQRVQESVSKQKQARAAAGLTN